MEPITGLLGVLALVLLAIAIHLATKDGKRAQDEAQQDEIDVVIGEGFTPHPMPFPGEADIERQIDAIIREAQDA